MWHHGNHIHVSFKENCSVPCKLLVGPLEEELEPFLSFSCREKLSRFQKRIRPAFWPALAERFALQAITTSIEWVSRTKRMLKYYQNIALFNIFQHFFRTLVPRKKYPGDTRYTSALPGRLRNQRHFLPTFKISDFYLYDLDSLSNNHPKNQNNEYTFSMWFIGLGIFDFPMP